MYLKVNPSRTISLEICLLIWKILKANVSLGESPQCCVRMDKIMLSNLKVPGRRRVLPKNENGRPWNSKMLAYPKNRGCPKPTSFLWAWTAISSTPPFLDNMQLSSMNWCCWFDTIPHPISSNLGSVEITVSVPITSTIGKQMEIVKRRVWRWLFITRLSIYYYIWAVWLTSHIIWINSGDPPIAGLALRQGCLRAIPCHIFCLDVSQVCPKSKAF